MRHDEHDIQAAIVAWFDMRFAGKNYNLIASANGGRRDAVTGARLKATGVRRGVPDLFLAVPMPIIYCGGIEGVDDSKWICGSGYHGLWIEVKTPTGRVTPEQQAFMTRQSELGYRCVVVRSVDEGIKTIESYLGIK